MSVLLTTSRSAKARPAGAGAASPSPQIPVARASRDDVRRPGHISQPNRTELRGAHILAQQKKSAAAARAAGPSGTLPDAEASLTAKARSPSLVDEHHYESGAVVPPVSWTRTGFDRAMLTCPERGNRTRPVPGIGSSRWSAPGAAWRASRGSSSPVGRRSRAGIDSGEGEGGPTSPERGKSARPREEDRQLRMERGILPKDCPSKAPSVRARRATPGLLGAT